MTDNPTLTENERIALLRGWEKLGPGVWRNPDGSIWNGVPDFLHDWAHAGPLWGEMICAVGLLEATKWVSREIIYEGQFPTEAELLLAISRAWLAWKEEEKDE